MLVKKIKDGAEIYDGRFTIRMFECDIYSEEVYLAIVMDDKYDFSGWVMEYDKKEDNLYVNYNHFYDVDKILEKEEYDIQYIDIIKNSDSIKRYIKRLVKYIKRERSIRNKNNI